MIWTWLVGLASGISIALVATSLKAKNITNSHRHWRRCGVWCEHCDQRVTVETRGEQQQAEWHLVFQQPNRLSKEQIQQRKLHELHLRSLRYAALDLSRTPGQSRILGRAHECALECDLPNLPVLDFRLRDI
jgi:hypothetical protein